MTQIEAHDFATIERALKSEEIVSHCPMREFLQEWGQVAHFTSQVYLVELASGLKAVLKLSCSRDAIAEVAAYRASEFLEIHLVPPTVLYVRGETVGSLQYYVEPSCDLMVEDNYLLARGKVSSEELANIELFYFIFGQWDPDPSNLIAVQEGEKVSFALIDNAAIGYRQKVRYGEYPFVLCFPDTHFNSDSSPSFPFDSVRLLPPDESIWRAEFGSILSESQIKQLCKLRWNPVSFVISEGHLWRQYRFGEPSFTNHYPTQTMHKIQELDYQTLKRFYSNEVGFEFDNQYYEDILQRRDQVVSASCS